METIDVPLTSLGRRERKKLETRRSIRDEALRLALELGMERLTVEAITEAADVSPRTFFNYFACKEDALVLDAAEAVASLRSQIVNRPEAEPPLHALRAVITDNELFVQADREQALARQRLVQENPPLLARQLAHYSSLERAFAEALAVRLGVDPDRDLRPVLLAGLAISVVRVALRRWTAGGTEPLRELLDSAFDVVENQILTDTPPRPAS